MLNYSQYKCNKSMNRERAILKEEQIPIGNATMTSGCAKNVPSRGIEPRTFALQVRRTATVL